MSKPHWRRLYEDKEGQERGWPLEPYAVYWGDGFVGSYESAGRNCVFRSSGMRFWWWVVKTSHGGNRYRAPAECWVKDGFP